MNFWKQFKPKTCTLRLQGDTKDAVLTEVVEALVAAEALTEDMRAAALAALLERERTGSTGVGAGVAIPHVKLAGLDRVACSLSVHADGVEWAAIDGAPVNLVFTVLRPEKASAEHDPEKHLEMMRWISRLSRDADFRRFALNVKTKTELVDLLKEKSAV
jgi:mannitol/fructose-specific phosphotransferase system IIA component (Ntr-type)